MARTACECVVLFDSTNLDKRSAVAICPWEDVDLLLTDGGLTDEDARRLEGRVRLAVAGQ